MEREEIRKQFINEVLFGRGNYYSITQTALETKDEDEFRGCLGLDSLDCVELLMDAERAFHIQITDEESYEAVTVGHAIDLISQKINY